MHASLKTLLPAVLAGAVITGLGAVPTAAVDDSSTTSPTAITVGATALPAEIAVAPALVAPALVAADIQVPTMARVLAHLASVPVLTPRQRLIAHAAVLRKEIAVLGRQQAGDTYRGGASGPNAFDCSGLTRYVFKKITGRSLPHNSGAQYNMAKKVNRKNAQPGDLVFYLRGTAHHVGLYLGNGKMVHAIGYGRGVKIEPIFGPWYTQRFSGIGRILPA